MVVIGREGKVFGFILLIEAILLYQYERKNAI